MVVTGWLNTKQRPFIQCASFSTNLRPCTLPHFTLSPVVDRGQVVDGSILQHRQEDEDEAHPQVNVHRLDVGHPGHGRVDSRDDGGHGQHCGDACTHTPPPFIRTDRTDRKTEGPGKLTLMLARVQVESNNQSYTVRGEVFLWVFNPAERTLHYRCAYSINPFPVFCLVNFLSNTHVCGVFPTLTVSFSSSCSRVLLF